MTQPHKSPALVRLPHCANQSFAQGAKLLPKYPVGMEKVRDRNVLLAAMIAAVELFLLLQQRGGFRSWYHRLAEEADQSLEVLGAYTQVQVI